PSPSPRVGCLDCVWRRKESRISWSDKSPKCSRRFGSRQSYKVSDCRQRVPSILPAAGNSGWYLLELDQPFDYQIKVGEPYQFRGTTITHFLIRSRWLGHALGGPEPVSVFVLLVEDGSVPTQGPIDVKHYFHQHGECVESRPTAPNTTLKPTSGAKSAKAKPVRTPRRSRLSV